MKNLSATERCRARLCLVGCLFVYSAAFAADRPAAFVVADDQIAALGITLLPLSSASPQVRTAYPAKVVMPPNADRVISSPVSGLLTQILALPGQAVDEGTPLLTVASSEYGQLQLDMPYTSLAWRKIWWGATLSVWPRHQGAHFYDLRRTFRMSALTP